jgi:hypothetical protein
VVNVSGESITTYTISNEQICEKVRTVMDGVPSTTPNEHAFYSTEYGKITHKRILKICRDRFSAEPDSIGRGDTKIRALTFVKDIVEKTGKTFEIISEIRILQSDEDENDTEDYDIDRWDIPVPIIFPSQHRPQKYTQNHARNGGMGTMGRKYSDFRGKKDNGSKKRFLNHISERESSHETDVNDNNSLDPGNGPISVPTSPGLSSGNDDADGGPFRCYHDGCRCKNTPVTFRRIVRKNTKDMGPCDTQRIPCYTLLYQR